MRKEMERILREIGVEPGDRLLVAVSGGADSVALLHLLVRLASVYPFFLRAAHLDHALREESRRDADFVAALCARLDIPLTTERRDVPREAKRRRVGIEEGAREVRREFLEGAAAAHGCRWIALGHHRGDQAETLLHRLLRGSSLPGLAGMRPCAPPYIRPLLGFSRLQLQGYLAAEGVEWVEDASNADGRFTRNRLRHHLLPALREFNPRVEEHLYRLSRRIAVEEDFWRGEVERALRRLGSVAPGEASLGVAPLLSLHPALRLRVIRCAVEIVRGDLRGIDSVHLEAVERLVSGARAQAEVSLPGAWAARRYAELWVRRTPPSLPGGFCIPIPGPGSYLLPDGRELRLSRMDSPLGEGPDAVEFDPVRVLFPLTVRTFSPGDRFRPEGAPGGKKLKDFFIDRKIPRELRRALPLVEGEEILWVVGVRRCEGSRPGAGGPVLRMTVSSAKTLTFQL